VARPAKVAVLMDWPFWSEERSTELSHKQTSQVDCGAVQRARVGVESGDGWRDVYRAKNPGLKIQTWYRDLVIM